MAVEIERKFLIDKEHSTIKHALLTNPQFISQCYLSKDPNIVVRIRILNDHAFLTIKGKTESLSRNEFEYPIPLSDAYELMKVHKGIIFKKRYLLQYEHDETKCWEIDVFDGLLCGLIVAEIELSSENDDVILPEWVNKEVSHDYRYFNSNLCHMVFNDETGELRSTQ